MKLITYPDIGRLPNFYFRNYARVASLTLPWKPFQRRSQILLNLEIQYP